ncbi:MAG: GTP cyclohydrolase II RibA [Beijerinckiaceae bacterium]|nr:GTP cyclohydrolase II RibA [Beijerinckiaceae bacterium]
MKQRRSRLIDDFDHLSVERAIAELRAGRAVIVTDDDRTGLIASVESVGGEMAKSLAEHADNKAHLVLTAARLRRIGVERQTAGAIALPRLDQERIATLALRLDARADAPVGATSVIDRAGLELAALALLIPAIIVIPLATPSIAGEAIQSIRAEAIEQYRRHAATHLSIVSRAPVPLEGAGSTEFVVFRGGEGLRDQVAIIVGTPDLETAVPTRLHSACLTGDLFGSLKCDCGDQLRETVKWMSENGGGVLLYLDQEGRGNGIANKIRAYAFQAKGLDTYDADELLGFDMDQRGFDFAAEMLRQLGVHRVTLLTNNPEKIASLRRSGIEVAAHKRIFGRETSDNVHYIATKRDKAGHLGE